MSNNNSDVRVVALPWSDDLLSAHLWSVGERTVVGVPELGLHCYGDSQSEAVLRLFSVLLKYYRQLKAYKSRLNDRALEHLDLLTHWVGGIEKKMTVKSREPVAASNIVSFKHSSR